MKKILFLVNADWAFIVNRLPIALKALQEGYEVHIACAFTGRQDELMQLGLVVHEIPFSRSGKNPFFEIFTLLKLFSVLRKVRPDLIHAITIKPVLYGGIVSKLLGVKAYVAAIAGLGLIFSSGGFKAKLLRTLVTFKYKFALSNKNKKVIFQNPHDRQTLQLATGLDTKDTVLIKGSGVNLRNYIFEPEPEGKIIIAMACRLLKDKGVFEFVEAAELIKNSYPNCDFWLIGSPDLGNPNSVSEAELDRIAADGFVKVLGHRNDIAELFRRAHIITLPSYYGEGLPKVLIEAAACGRPAVTTDNPGCSEAVVDGETGFIVPERSVSELVTALVKLIESRALRIKMGASARAHAERYFDINGVVSTHLEVYEELLRNKN